VKAMLNQDIIREASRLTRAGQLLEATALLQRMLRGESAPNAPSRTGSRIALTGREPLIIDAKANAIEETDGHSQLKPATPHNRACSGRSWIAKRGALKSDCEV
jgi:hypothetical protein